MRGSRDRLPEWCFQEGPEELFEAAAVLCPRAFQRLRLSPGQFIFFPRDCWHWVRPAPQRDENAQNFTVAVKASAYNEGLNFDPDDFGAATAAAATQPPLQPVEELAPVPAAAQPAGTRRRRAGQAPAEPVRPKRRC